MNATKEELTKFVGLLIRHVAPVQWRSDIDLSQMHFKATLGASDEALEQLRRAVQDSYQVKVPDDFFSQDPTVGELHSLLNH